MAAISVYYDYYDDVLSPKWMLIKFKSGELDWNKNYLYVPVNVPFKRKLAEDFGGLDLGLTITLVDFVMSEDKPNQFGISFESIKARVNKMRGDGNFPYMLDEINQFILLISDLEEILAIDKNELYAWR